MNKISVLIVDDSAVVRQVLTGIIENDPKLTVSAAVADPIFAMKRMQMNWPDVILLDVNMPRMNGIEFLKQIMSERPTPVVMCSSLTTEGSETALQAMAAGAIEIIAKPKLMENNALSIENRRILEAIKCASQARNLDRLKLKESRGDQKITNLTVAKHNKNQSDDFIVAIGTSTGGTQALQEILTKLPEQCPPILVVQHMPEKFTSAFAKRLNQVSKPYVKEAQHGDEVTAGTVLIAPGGRHMSLKHRNEKYHVILENGAPVNRHKPSVDVLFNSVAKHAGKNAVGIIMTGMGNDGARGLKEMYDSGAYTLAQNKHTCIVYGMPKEAIELNAVTREVALDDIAREIMNHKKVSDSFNTVSQVNTFPSKRG